MIINNYSQNYKQPAFKQLPFKKLNGIKVFDEIHCKPHINDFGHTDGKDYFLRIENDYVPNEFYIDINDNMFNPVGQSKITIKKDHTLYNDSIDVIKKNSKYSGIGTIMRLGQIVTMLENDLNKIELHSLGQAVFFHSKFKFEPAITDLNELKDYIQLDLLSKENDKRFTDVVNSAKEWLKNDKLSYKDKLKTGNNILYNYLQSINKHKLNFDEDFQIYPGFDMVLTKEKVLNNKDFFNKLFEKFDIDYNIKD